MSYHDDFDHDDEWYTDRTKVRVASSARHVPAPPPRRARDDDILHRTVRGELLDPEQATYTTSLSRTRSQGHAPIPNINIYASGGTARNENDSNPTLNPHIRTDQRSRDPSPAARGRGPVRMYEDWQLEHEVAGLREELAKQRRHSRSRSRYRDDSRDRSPSRHGHGHGHGHAQGNPDYDKWQLQQAQERIKEAEDRLQAEKREELLKKQLELKYRKEKEDQEDERIAYQKHEELVKRQIELKYRKEKEERAEEEAAQEKREELIKKQLELKYRKEREDRFEEEQKLKDQEARIKQEMELKQEKEERQRIQRAKEAEIEKQRIIAENTLKLERQEREVKAERQAAVDAFNKKQAQEERDAKEERERIVAEYERKKFVDAEKAKTAREALIMQLKIEEEKQKQKEKEEWERFLRKQKEKEEEEAAKKKAEEERLEGEMRKRLAQFGFQENQIQAMIKPEDAIKQQQQYQPQPQYQHQHQHQHHHTQLQLQLGASPNNPLPRLAAQPTYVKVHKEHLAVDTLHYYDIPYEIDRADPNYIIVLREMDQRETEVLFEHTRRLRSRGSSRLLIEQGRDRHDKPEYAWVRKKAPSRSPSRRRSSPKRVVGLRDLLM